MTPIVSDDDPSDGPGMMEERIRAFDWSSTSLGPMDTWPQALQTVLAIMLNSSQAMFATWGQERLLLYNGGYAEILGRKHPDALGRPFHDVWSELDRDVRPILDRAYQGVPVYMHDLHLVLQRNGFPEDAFFSFSYTPLTDQSGKVAGVFCPCVETTEKVLTERKLVEREREARSLAANTPVILTRFDRQYRHLFANEAAAASTGATVSEVLGKTSRELGMPEKLCDYWEEQIDLAFQTRTSRELEFAFDGPDGTQYFEAKLVPEFAADDESVVHVLGVAHDVTDRKSAEIAIRRREAQLQALFDAAPLGIYVLDADLHFIHVNPIARETLAEVPDLIGSDLADVLSQVWPAEMANDLVARFRHTLETGTPYFVPEVAEERQDRGSTEYYEWQIHRMPLPDGSWGVVAYFREISVHVKAREAIAESERSLRRQNSRLQTLYDLSDAALRASGIDEMCRIALDGLLKATEADRGSILLFDDANVMRFRAWRGISEKYRAAVEGHSPWKPTDIDARPLTVADVLEDDSLKDYHTVFQAEDIRALGFIPLVDDGRVLGKFMTYFREPHAFTEDELALCRAVAASVASCANRINAAHRLRRERDLVRTIAENSTLGLAMMDEHGFCTFANQALLTITGYSAEEIASKPLHDLIHHHYPDGRPYPIEECPIDRALPENFDVRAHEDLFFRKDGSSFPVLCAASPIFEDGRPVSTVVEIRDVTSEKQAQEALRRSEQRFRKMADTAPAMIWVTDMSGAWTFVSRGWTDFTRQVPEDALGFGWIDLVHPDDRGTTRQWVESGSATRHPIALDFRVRRSDGHYRWIFAEGRPRFDDAGECCGFIGSLIDVHDRQMATEALRRSEQHLRELSQSLEQRVAERTSELRKQTARLRRLTAALASAEQRERKRLAAMLHDEVQQLLVAATMKMVIARSTTRDPTAQVTMDEAAQHLQEAITAARDLTQQLRPPTLYEAGLRPALEWLATEMQRRYKLDVSVTGGPLAIELSDDTKALLFDCARELLFNTVKHARTQQATVNLQETDEQLELVVSDPGFGFDPASLSVDQQGGGFGLFSIRERIAALGGTMTIASAPEDGTSISLVMPLSIARPEADRRARRDGRSDSERHDRKDLEPGRIKVLIVDDHAIIREGLARILKADARLAVVGEAADGEAALEALLTVQPDVVLVDVNMPRMNGVDATREIRRLRPEAAVIGLSVQEDAATAKSMLDAGAAAFVPKAGHPGHLIESIVQVHHGARGLGSGTGADGLQREPTAA